MSSFQHSKSVVNFRRWTRKPYAVFNSLGRLIRIGVLLYTFSILREPCRAQQTDTLLMQKTLPDDEVVITAQRVPVLASQASRPLGIMAPELIQQLALATPAEALDLMPGVDVRQRGAPGTQADISLRGGSFDQTLILLNGINLTNPQTGHHSFDLPLVPRWLSKIEVLRGPAARIWGSNAFAGAVNLVTPFPSSDASEIQIQGGQHQLISVDGSLMRSLGKWGIFTGIAHQSHNGFAPNTDASQQLGFARAVYSKGEESMLDLQAGFSHRAFGANSFYSLKYPDQFEETFAGFVSASGTIQKKRFSLTPKAYFRKHFDRFELFRYQAPSWYKGPNYHSSLIAGLQIPANLSWKGGITSLGIDGRYETILSNVLGEPLKEQQKVPMADSAFYTRQAGRYQVGVYVNHLISFNRFTLSSGTLFNWLSSLHRWEIYPGVDISYESGPNSHIYWSVNRSLRLPTYTDLYYQGPTNIANPQLKPETALAYETGWRYHAPAIATSVDLFLRKGRNLIDWVRGPGEEKWRSVNHTRVDVYGAEFSFLVSNSLAKSLWRMLSDVGMSYSFTHASKTTDTLASRYVLDPLRHKLTLTTLIQPLPSLSVGINSIYQYRVGQYIAYEKEGTEIARAYGGSFMADIKVTFTGSNWEFSFSAQNVTNAKYYDHGGVPLPGRWFVLGLVLKNNN
ncbi:MAG: TonB-dependent receptor plug domain-containing protein [Bacteroidales bacterium]